MFVLFFAIMNTVNLLLKDGTWELIAVEAHTGPTVEKAPKKLAFSL